MERKILKLGMIALCYSLSDDGNVAFSAVPSGTENDVNWEVIENGIVKNRLPEPIIQLAVKGDVYPNSFQNGLTLRNASGRSLKFLSQIADEDKIVTVLEGNGKRAIHTVEKVTDFVLKFNVELINIGEKDFTIERLDTFSLSGVSPFYIDHVEGDLTLVRVRSHWSQEGVVERIDPYDINFFPSWSKWQGKAEKWGGIGSMPNLNYVPLSGVEDNRQGISYGLFTEACGSWQTEFYRESDAVCWGSGIADFYYGQWQKTLGKNQSFKTENAYFTCLKGSFDDCCRKLVRMQETEFPIRLDCEKDLPIVFNEYGTTWGVPSEERLTPLVDCVKKLDGVKYFVIDAGWFKSKDKSWEAIGDWNESSILYPNGFKKMIDKIKDAGLRPGIWFEWEGVSSESEIWHEMKDCLLQRQGDVIRCGHRSFFDFENLQVREYFHKKVVEKIISLGLGYVKIDNNENIGIGCDGKESLCEGLRSQMLAVKDCYEKLRNISDLVLEICSSGGMRIEPGFIKLADQMSVSDTHECDEGGIVAANMQRILHPSKSQIWAVVRVENDLPTLAHTLSKAFLGRMCLSGDIDRLNESQMNIVKKAISFYRSAVSVIKHGDSYIIQEGLRNFRKLDGAFAVVRKGDCGQTLVVINSYGRESYRIEHFALSGRILEVFSCGQEDFDLKDGVLTVSKLNRNRAGVALLIEN